MYSNPNKHNIEKPGENNNGNKTKIKPKQDQTSTNNKR